MLDEPLKFVIATVPCNDNSGMRLKVDKVDALHNLVV
jgi:hypothetical protein